MRAAAVERKVRRVTLPRTLSFERERVKPPLRIIARSGDS
jgi:hypothetical protein